MTEAQWAVPLTTVQHLDFNAGEDVSLEVVVTDRDGQPVILRDAVAVVGHRDDCTAPPQLHLWSPDAGNLVLADQRTAPGVLRLHTSRVETAAWSKAWGDAGWQLEAVDVFGRKKRVMEGRVRVWASRRRKGGEDG